MNGRDGRDVAGYSRVLGNDSAVAGLRELHLTPARPGEESSGCGGEREGGGRLGQHFAVKLRVESDNGGYDDGNDGDSQQWQ